MKEELFANFEGLQKEIRYSQGPNLLFTEVARNMPKVARITKPVLFLFPVPQVPTELSASRIESDTFYARAANSLAALRPRINSFGITYMVTGRGTVNYITLPEFENGIGKITESISILRNSGFLQSLGIRGNENTMLGVDPFIAYEGESVTGRVVIKGNPYDGEAGKRITSWLARSSLKDYDTDSDIWPLPQPSLGTSFMSSILDSAAEIQKEIAAGLEGRLHVIFNFRPVVMNTYKGLPEIERKINPPPPLFGSPASQRLPRSNNLSREEEDALRGIKNQQFRSERARSAYQVEALIFAVYPRNESREKWSSYVASIAEKGTSFYQGGTPYNNEWKVPHARFSSVEVSLTEKENRNPLFLYLRNEFFKGIAGEKKLGRVEPNRAISVQEAARMISAPSNETMSNLRIVNEKGKVNTLPGLELLYERVFGKKPDPSTMIDGYGQRTTDARSGEDQRNG